MAVYDFSCSACGLIMEMTCPIAERESQLCIQCGSRVEPLFSPPSQVIIPNAFRYSFSDLFGTSSEKDYLKANPNLVRSNPSTSNDIKARKRRERDREIKEGLDIEKSLLAQGKLKRPITVEAGSEAASV